MKYTFDSDRERPRTKEGELAKQLPIVRDYGFSRLRGDVPPEMIEFFDILFAPLMGADTNHTQGNDHGEQR